MKHPLRKYAVFRVWKAIKQGRLIRPEHCSNCGNNPGRCRNGSARIQAHHHKGYDIEFILDVIWLCPSCHKIAHPNDAAALAKISAANLGRKRTMESRQKQSQTVKGYTGERKGWTPERREAQRKRMLERWTPEERLKQSDRCKRDMPWLGRGD